MWFNEYYHHFLAVIQHYFSDMVTFHLYIIFGNLIIKKLINSSIFIEWMWVLLLFLCTNGTLRITTSIVYLYNVLFFNMLSSIHFLLLCNKTIVIRQNEKLASKRPSIIQLKLMLQQTHTHQHCSSKSTTKQYSVQYSLLNFDNVFERANEWIERNRQ